MHVPGAGRFFAEGPFDALAGVRDGGLFQRVNGLFGEFLPAFEGVAVDPGFELRAWVAAEDGVKEVTEYLDVAGGGAVFSGAQMQPEVLLPAQKFVDSEGVAVSLFIADGVGGGFGETGVEHEAAWSDEGEEGVLIDGQFVLAAGEEAQARVEPVGLAGSEELNAFIGEGFAGETPRVGFAAVAAGGDGGGDALVEGRGEKGRFAVAGVAGDADLGLVYFGEGIEVVDGAGSGPGPAREDGEVYVGVDVEPGVGVVTVSVARVGGVVDAGDVAAANGGVDPGAVVGVVGEEDGEGALAVGDDEFDAEGGFVVRAEFEADLADGGGAFAMGVGDDGAEVGGSWREVTEHPAADLLAQMLLARGPLGLSGDALERVGQAGDGGQAIEIGREFAGAPDPFLPGAVEGVEASVGRLERGAEERQQLVERGGGVCCEEGEGGEKQRVKAHRTASQCNERMETAAT